MPLVHANGREFPGKVLDFPDSSMFVLFQGFSMVTIPTLVFLQATNDTWSGFVLQAIHMMGGFDLKVPNSFAADGFSNKPDTDAAEFYRLAEAISREK